MKRLMLVFLLAFSFGLGHAQTLVYGQSGLPDTLDTGQDGNSLTVGLQMLEPLVGFETGTAELTEKLATSWEANDDSTAWTFTLREGVTFHDGSAFDAEAVKFNFDRWNNQDNEYAFSDEGKDFTSWTYIFSNYFGEDGYLLESVEVVDPTTVTFNLTSPVGFFPAMVASSYFGMHSPTAVMEGGIEYGTPSVGAVGTGPFQFVEWTTGDRVTVERYADYWGEAAGVESIVFRGIEETATRLAELEAGTIDIAVNLSPEDIDTIEGNADLAVASAEANLSLGYIGMHQDNPPFDIPEVRQAVAHAIDYEAIVDAFYGELGSTAGEFVPPGLIGRAELDAYEYDPERSRELLAEAGFPDGFDTEFWYMPVSRPYYPVPQDIAEAVASQLSEVGINAELLTEEWGIYLEDYTAGKFPMYMLGWSADYADPNNFVFTFFGPSQSVSAFGWDSPETLELLEQARAASSEEERQGFYEGVANNIYDDVPAIPVVYPRTLNATRTAVEGFAPNPLGTTIPLAPVTKTE